MRECFTNYYINYLNQILYSSDLILYFLIVYKSLFRVNFPRYSIIFENPKPINHQPLTTSGGSKLLSFLSHNKPNCIFILI